MPEVVSLSEAKRNARKSGGGSDGSGSDGLRGPTELIEEFRTTTAGVFSRRVGKDGEASWVFVCSPIEIVAETRSADGTWGVLIAWTDRDGATCQESFGRNLLTGDCAELRQRLAAKGVTFDQHPFARMSFGRYLSLVKSPERADVVTRPGWVINADRLVYALPDATFGTASRPIVFEGQSNENPFQQAGTLDAWKRDVSKLAPGNTRLLFALSAGFTGPLLHLADEDNFGVHLRGPSRSGKSAILKCAGSIWGGGPKTGAGDFVNSWRATANGIEILAARANDGLLLLDELAEADPGAAAETSYQIANGRAKTRMTRDGSAAGSVATWRTVFISTGEMSLAEKIGEARRSTHAGQELRFLDIEADAGVGMGVFGQLHEHESADELVAALRAGTRANYGTAGRHFLSWLTEKLAADNDFIDRIGRNTNELAAKWLERAPAAAAQIRSTARRFALVATAGELATEAGTTGWASGDAAEACGLIFQEWLQQRGTLGSLEEKNAIDLLTAFIGRNATSFELWPVEAGDAAPYETEANPPNDRQRQGARYGFRRWQRRNGQHGWTHYVYPSAMKEALAGLNFQSAVKNLASAGSIEPSNEKDGRVTQKVRLPGARIPERVYIVPNGGHPSSDSAGDE